MQTPRTFLLATLLIACLSAGLLVVQADNRPALVLAATPTAISTTSPAELCADDLSAQIYSKMITDCSAAIARDPRNAEAYTYRGVAYNASGNTSAALGDLNRALAIDPNFARAY